MYMFIFENDFYELFDGGCGINLKDIIVELYCGNDTPDGTMDSDTFREIAELIDKVQLVELYNSVTKGLKIRDIFSGLQVEY